MLVQDSVHKFEGTRLLTLYFPLAKGDRPSCLDTTMVCYETKPYALLGVSRRCWHEDALSDY